MKKFNQYTLLMLLAGGTLASACSSDDPTPSQLTTDKYVLITLSDRVSGNKAGFISAFDELPTGTVSNSGAGSLEGQGMGGWRTHGNNIYKMFRTSDYATGIEKINVAADGTVTAGQFIASKNPTEADKYFGTGNFVIKDDNLGYYWDAAEPTKIQKFNPSTMSNIGSLDFADAINERGEDGTGINFRAIGQKFLAIKGNKLFANLTYAKNTTSQGQIGFFDDFYPDVYIAVIDLGTETHEKTIAIKNTGSIAYINENHMYDFDTNGDLYIVCQGRSAIGGQSKIVRIKANETDIDPSWELDFAGDFTDAYNGKFVGVFAKGGELILTVNTGPLTGGPNGNINSANIWKFYAVDVASKAFTEITGVPVGTNPGAAMAAVEVDGKILLRGSTVSGENGYYEYDPASHSAELLFNVNVGGAVSGFHKIEVQ
ncbi:hypothetical protein JHJ32_09275 [Parapedobacter sp. ISTM3]|uniref:DUF4374 domain-containing protein n=1 Tax=Parapedobacter luteus TaxID=623280 RepID=A0A1T5A4C2_9SPHI|nr:MULTISPECIES: hypothetical protein [Parapedobacter]MBK1440175.1 hypothetical protein [Parapedobacter sp. ISTM3]SKB29788.1 hypothetical protein SAMN05660226_00578 [Parapedobacter luteus]